MTSLQVQETRGEVVRVTWVGVQGATAYRVSWRRTDGGFVVVISQFDKSRRKYFKEELCSNGRFIASTLIAITTICSFRW